MLVAYLLNSFLVAATVLIHHESLNGLFRLGQKLSVRRNLAVLIGVFGALFAHVAEIWLFALGYYYMVRSEDFETLAGNFDGSLIDCVYFSFTTYTSLGFGDIEPMGYLRFTAGLEALAGLMMITWSASFMFLKMQKYWEV
ncbi:potassium channel family protein [Microbulbifer thermotolerans]|uniref:Ion transporter n=1 Tax=Microbulbifer thermotolerans TaxID=252514 RepID=A0A143HMX6_MICTH|nr:potassium channel family protein [Microbulbifer thermotolerans]AMX03049.1 ion transporter [Microbulbifer thermotolerans]MCX2779013.1 potassium channel family protein [Microbulbifer thermotolerans]MCX2781476.1 potassium channel family protein [Microbulbifer thermotolerans]MCX2795715.1 potassium channel family protein [Microbulbifer thermotolerans]MCX2802043.1 potassium channel family protein [Microbulbifer thermotolerans]